jgi:hypothetical protein
LFYQTNKQNKQKKYQNKMQTVISFSFFLGGEGDRNARQEFQHSSSSALSSAACLS